MKKFVVIIFSLCVFSVKAQNSNQEIIRLPLTYKSGFGPFLASYGGLEWENKDTINSWYKTYLPIKGIPADWTVVKKGIIFFDIYQFVYQNYIAGNISSDFYHELQNSWSWVPDTTHLSKNPLACYVYVVSGKNKAGQQMLVIDSRNKLDVSDDIPFLPAKFNSGVSPDGQPYENIHQISHERFVNGKIIKVSSPLLILSDSLHAWYSMPQYATTMLISGSKSFNINVASNFVSDDLANASLTIMEHSPKKISEAVIDSTVKKGEYITIANKLYCNNGVDGEGMLNLRAVTGTDSLYSTQMGYRALPFTGKRFDTGEKLSLAALKGKYVFIDFWGTWCSPCRAELPYLKEAYQNIDKNKVAFIGIVSDDSFATLKATVDKEGITWPQILSVQEDNIASLYNINSYPTNFLIDPQGRIVAKNLRGTSLAAKLKELIK